MRNTRDATIEKATLHYEQFLNGRNAARWSSLNWSFHSSLYEDAAKPFILRQVKSVHDRIERYLRVQLTLADGKAKSDCEHLRILEACKAGDSGTAAALTHDHVMGACESLLRSQPSQPD